MVIWVLELGDAKKGGFLLNPFRLQTHVKRVPGKNTPHTHTHTRPVGKFVGGNAFQGYRGGQCRQLAHRLKSRLGFPEHVRLSESSCYDEHQCQDRKKHCNLTPNSHTTGDQKLGRPLVRIWDFPLFYYLLRKHSATHSTAPGLGCRMRVHQSTAGTTYFTAPGSIYEVIMDAFPEAVCGLGVFDPFRAP